MEKYFNKFKVKKDEGLEFNINQRHAYNQGIISPHGTPQQKIRDSRAYRVDLLVKVQRELRGFSCLICDFKSPQSKCLCHCMKLLTSLQRIPAIFLLIENYKTEGISHHPFGATILELVQNTPEPFEKRMISDIIIDSQREEYSRIEVEVLYEREQSELVPIEDRPEIIHIKEQFLANLPHISQQSQSEVNNVVRDFLDKDKQYEIPEHQVGLGSIKESEIDEEAFNVGFMRPIPKFIDVDSSEFHWLSPSISPEVMWDNTPELNMKIKKAKGLLKKGLEQHLTKDECTLIEKTLDSEPTAVLHLEIVPEMLNSLIKQNPFLAVAYLVKLSNYPIITTYLDALILCEVNINSIDVALKVIKSMKTPNNFTAKYTSSILDKVLEMDEANKDRLKLARVVIGFIKNVKKNKVGESEEVEERLEKFLVEFMGVEEVQQYVKLVSKE